MRWSLRRNRRSCTLDVPARARFAPAPEPLSPARRPLWPRAWKSLFLSTLTHVVAAQTFVPKNVLVECARPLLKLPGLRKEDFGPGIVSCIFQAFPHMAKEHRGLLKAADDLP